jgi:hypothetical protein
MASQKGTVMSIFRIVMKIVSVFLLIWAFFNFCAAALFLLSAGGVLDFASGSPAEKIPAGAFLLVTGSAYLLIGIFGFRDLRDSKKFRLYFIALSLGAVVSLIGAVGIVSSVLNDTWPITSLAILAICLVFAILVRSTAKPAAGKDK